MTRQNVLATAFIATAMITTAAAAQECFDHDTYMPVVHDEYFTGANVRQITMAGDLLLLACDEGGLRIYDASIPTAPVLLSIWTGLATVKVTAVVDDLCYVGGGAGGLTILDIADPEAPVVVGHGATVDPIVDLVVRGGLAYVAASNYGLVIWDVSDPSAPHGISGRPTGGGGTTIVVTDHHAFLDGAGPIVVFDVSDPGNPVSVTTIDVMDGVFDLDLAGDWICAVGMHTDGGSHGRLVMIDVHDPAQPQAQMPLALASAFYVRLVGDRAFVAAGGMTVVDVADPAAPRSIGRCSALSSVNCVDVSGEFAFIGGYRRLYVVDVRQPFGPAVLGSLDLDASVRQVACVGSLSYVAAWSDGLEIVDTGDPTAPVLLGAIDTPGSASGVVVKDGRAYVADGAAGLRIVDVADPASPVTLGSVDTPGLAVKVQLAGSLAYVADSWSGLQVVDVSDHSTPTIIGTFATGNLVSDVILVGDLAVVVDDHDALQSVDISDPTAPVAGYAIDLFSEVRTLASHDGWVYALCANSLRQIRLPQMWDVSTSYLAGDPQDFVIHGEHVYIAEASGALSVRGFDPPQVLAEIDALIYWQQLVDVTAVGSRLVVTNLDGVLSILPAFCDSVITATPPAAPIRRGPAITMVAPNPFNPRTECRFELDRAQRVALTLYDLRGRRVRSLLDGDLPAGAHVTSWNGRDDHGRSAPAGVYLLELRGATGRDCRRVSLVK